MTWTIDSCKGSYTAASLLACLEWQAEHQAALATITGPGGVEYDLDDLPDVALADDPHRDADALTVGSNAGGGTGVKVGGIGADGRLYTRFVPDFVVVGDPPADGRRHPERDQYSSLPWVYAND